MKTTEFKCNNFTDFENAVKILFKNFCKHTTDNKHPQYKPIDIFWIGWVNLNEKLSKNNKLPLHAYSFLFNFMNGKQHTYEEALNKLKPYYNEIIFPCIVNPTLKIIEN